MVQIQSWFKQASPAKIIFGWYEDTGEQSPSGYLFVKRTNLEVTILKITVLVLNKFVRPHLVL